MNQVTNSVRPGSQTPNVFEAAEVGEPKRPASERQPVVNPRSTSPLRLSPYLVVKGSTVSTKVSTQLYREEA